MKYILKKITEKDKKLTKLINDRCYKDVVIRQFGSWNEDLQLKFFEDKWNQNKGESIIANQEIIGTLMVFDKGEFIILSEINIDPDFQNKGYGTLIVKDLITKATEQKKNIKLQVLKMNRATKLYKKLGFKTYDENETHYLMEYYVQPVICSG